MFLLTKLPRQKHNEDLSPVPSPKGEGNSVAWGRGNCLKMATNPTCQVHGVYWASYLNSPD
jgi:hypothetical protein